MKKTVLFLAALVCVGFAGQAQDAPRFGIVGGLQSSALRNSTSTSGKFGIHLGGVAEVPLSEQFLLRPQLLYSMKGGSEDGVSVNISYLELPIHAVYKAEVGSGKLFGGIGPYFAYALGGSVSDDSDSAPLTIGTDIKGFDAGFSLLGGYELTEQKLSINLFYNSGLTGIIPNASRSTTNGTFGLSVAYFFGE